jgi:hypothetical protein
MSLLLYINCGAPQSTDQSSFSRPYTIEPHENNWGNTDEGEAKTLLGHFFSSFGKKSTEPPAESPSIEYSGRTVKDYLLDPDEYDPKSMRDRLDSISSGNEIVSPSQTHMMRQHSGYIDRVLKAQERELEAGKERGQTDTEEYQRLVNDHKKSKRILEDMKHKASHALSGGDDEDTDYNTVREKGDFYANPIDDTLTWVDTERVVYFPESEPEEKSWWDRIVESLIGSNDQDSNSNDSNDSSSSYGERKDDTTCFLDNDERKDDTTCFLDDDDQEVEQEEGGILSGFDKIVDNVNLKFWEW